MNSDVNGAATGINNDITRACKAKTAGTLKKRSRRRLHQAQAAYAEKWTGSPIGKSPSLASVSRQHRLAASGSSAKTSWSGARASHSLAATAAEQGQVSAGTQESAGSPSRMSCLDALLQIAGTVSTPECEASRGQEDL